MSDTNEALRKRDDAMRETLDHCARVGVLMAGFTGELVGRALTHDRSKFDPEEWPAFAEATPKLKETTYGSSEYRANLDKIRPSVERHQKTNRHHPEYHADGIQGMTLVDLLEMLCDWKAAGERHADGSIEASIAQGVERFGISDELRRVLSNTAEACGWIEAPHWEEPLIYCVHLPAGLTFRDCWYVGSSLNEIATTTEIDDCLSFVDIDEAFEVAARHDGKVYVREGQLLRLVKRAANEERGRAGLRD